jgi:hypothetical protein
MPRVATEPPRDWASQRTSVGVVGATVERASGQPTRSNGPQDLSAAPARPRLWDCPGPVQDYSV